MYDVVLVRGVDDLGDVLEERDELIERHRAARGEPRLEGVAVDELHRDPEQAIGFVGAERVDVRGVGVIEHRSELNASRWWLVA